jgi:predicted O-linked N-acetylglucosamine transferase (SPINDLY family)
MLGTEENSSQQSGKILLQEGYYDQAISFYEQAIETEPDNMSHYWHLGLAYLLQEQEEAAQATWALAMSQGTTEEIEQWTKELSQILDTEAQRQLDLNHNQNAWLIRQHLREINPTEVNNILHLLLLSLTLDSFTLDLLKDWQIVEILEQSSPDLVDSNLLLQALKKLAEFSSEETLAFVTACLPYVRPPEIFIDTLVPVAIKVAYIDHRPLFAAKLAELCLKLNPVHAGALQHLSCFYTNAGSHQQGIETAKKFYNNCQSLDRQVLGNYLILRALLSAAAWQEVGEVAQRHESLLRKIIQEQPEDLDRGSNLALIISPFFLPYIQDNLQKNCWLRNQLGQLFQKNVRLITPTLAPRIHYESEEKLRPLRIGYIAHTLRSHSVGWLSRWLLYYHDREAFHTTIYCLQQNLEDRFTQTWFRDKVNVSYGFVHNDAPAIAEQIKKDQIDILVDLDSITLDTTCEVMALKPAPVQVTWLGWDASGIPAIDYFIADPYVLPEDAQANYQENIWRLPQTYVAVDGFEVGIANLRRDSLGIPTDAIVYFSAQRGYKRHPDTTRLQIQILKEVSNSYFLIKGLADELTIRQSFTQMAEEAGVDPERLKFVPPTSDELVHRANLAIADVVLDTYPYNGATTTLETLWMGIPLVTRVGQQFAARNSYAFMMNVGVTEGIAWTDEEYVEWGVRFGKDEALRQQVAWKLRQSRQTSPLWNAKQFTREMEKAYQQMWQRYVEAGE